MRSKILFSAITSSIALASTLHFAPDAHAALQTPPEKLETLYGLLGELKAEVDDVRKEWVDAQNGVDKLRAESAALKKKIVLDAKLRKALPGGPPSPDIASYQNRLAKIGTDDCSIDGSKELCVAIKAAEQKHSRLSATKARYSKYVALAGVEESNIVSSVRDAKMQNDDVKLVTKNFADAKKEIQAAAALSDNTDPYIPTGQGTVLAFNRDFDGIFQNPNKFMVPKDGKTIPPDARNASAPAEVANASTGELLSRVGSFLFDRSSDRRGSGAALTLTEDESKMTLQFGFNNAGKSIYCAKDGTPNCDGKVITGDQGYQSSFTVSGFLASKKGFGALFNGKDDSDTLTNYGGSVGYTRTSFRKRSRIEMELTIKAAEKSLTKACIVSFAGKKASLSAAEIQRECSGIKLVKWAHKTKGDEKAGTFINSESLKLLELAVWAQTQPLWDWGLTGSVGQKKLNYIDITQAAVGTPANGTVGFAKFVDGTNRFKSTKTEWKLEAHLGLFGYVGDKAKEANVYGAIFAEIGREFKEGDKSNVCPVATASTVPVICQNLILSEAEKNKFARLGVQGKVQVPGWGVFPKFGIAPRFSVDLQGKKFKKWELPISLISDKEGSLNAGIKFSDEWGGSKIDPMTLERSDPSDGFTVGLFVGKAFNVGF